MAGAPSAPDPTLIQDLAARLAATSAVIDAVVCLVPPKQYFPPTEQEKEAEWLRRSKYAKHTKKPAAEAKAERRKAKHAGKAAKLDATRFETVLDRQAKLAAAGRSGDDDDDDDDDMVMVASDGEGPIGLEEGFGSSRNSGGKRRADVQHAQQDDEANGEQAAPTVLQLRQRLAAKIAEQSGKRGTGKRRRAASATDEPGRREKRRRQDQPSSKRGASAALDASKPSLAYASVDVRNTSAVVPSYVEEEQRKLNRARKQNRLAEAEASQARLTQLKQAGDTAKVQEATWDKLEAKARGEKLRDDPALLRKAAKREEAKKKRSAEQWKERGEKQAAFLENRQKRREQNIKTMKEKRIAKKRGIKPAKSAKSPAGQAAGKKLRPGFEGKKRGFLNKGKPVGSSKSS